MRSTGMTSGRKQQQGVAMVIVTIGMLAMMAMAGLALDMGDMYINKTRLQNTLDAAALSAARDLSAGGDLASATAAARDTFNLNEDEGNQVLAAIPDADINVEISGALMPWVPNSGTQFVRVSVDTFTRESFLISVLGINDKPVRASATAGLQPVGGEGCAQALPIFACGDASDPDNFGYTPGQQVTLKLGAPGGGCDPGENGPGNFNFLDATADGGADAIRRALCGLDGLVCVGEGHTNSTKPGNTVSAAQGINTRFGDYPPPGPSYLNPDSCPADTNTTEYTSPPTSPPYYEPHYLAGQPPDGRRLRRIVPIPVGECTCAGGDKQVSVLGVECFLITERFDQTGHGFIKGEFLGDTDSLGEPITCLTAGDADPDPPGASGAVRIILYKDQVRPDA